MTIEDRLLTMGGGHGRGGAKLEAQGVVVHYVGNPGSSALANRNYFENGGTGASAHYVVGLRGEILCCVPENERAAHAGKSYAAKYNEIAATNNARYIGIENCHPDPAGKFSAATYAALTALIVDIFKRYKWGAKDVDTRLLRHYDCTGKSCPLYYVSNPAAWDALKNDVRAMLTQRISEPTGTPLIGKAAVTAETLAAFLLSKNPAPKLNGVDAFGLAKLYISEGDIEGIRGDIAFCQSCVETGYWKFGGDVLPSQNNFAGIGTTGGGVKGANFATAQIGVRAQIQHLKAYATADALKQACVDPRYGLVSPKGKAPTVEGLSGTWAADKKYAATIMNVYNALSAFEPTAPKKLYTVKVTADSLNIRSGAGTNNAKVDLLAKGSVCDIFETANGEGAKKWGKTGEGWISLDHTIKQ